MQYLEGKEISNLKISFNPNGWGPISGEKSFAFGDMVYAHFDKKEKINRVSDFASTHNYPNKPVGRYRRDDGNVANAEFVYRHDTAEDNTFQLVDTTAKTSKMGKKMWGQGGGRGQQRPGYNQWQGGVGGYNKKPQELQVTFNSGKNVRGGKTSSFIKGKNGVKSNRRVQKVDRNPSLTVSSEWQIIEEFDLAQLLKLQANAPKIDDLGWHGYLDQYNELYEKLSVRTAKPLQKNDNKIFYSVTTQDDPVMEKFLSEDMGDIYATDSILAHLVSAPRSVYSWDIIIEKTDGKIFLDKRENSDFDLLTVSETSQEPPIVTEDLDEFNHPGKLSIEATAINQKFSQQILNSTDPATRKKVSYYHLSCWMHFNRLHDRMFFNSFVEFSEVFLFIYSNSIIS